MYHVLALEGFLAGVCHGQNCFYMGPFSILATTWQVDLKEEKNLERGKVKRLFFLSKQDDRWQEKRGNEKLKKY